MENGFERLAIPLVRFDGTEAGWWVIERGSRNVSLDPADCVVTGGVLPSGWKALEGADENASGPSPVQVVERSGLTFIRLLETQRYEWSVEESSGLPDPRLQSSLDRCRDWNVKRCRSGDFRVVNHLGLADFRIEADGLVPLDLRFEFISRKLDFDSEYRRMTEDIADFCRQLLLSWEAPTRLYFNADPSERHKLLLEQFLFLKNFMTDERLRRLMEAISRNPHSILIRESEWVPAPLARSSDFLSSPHTMIRDWRRIGGKPIPGEVKSIRKCDTHDTAPNRFLKFALSQFRKICADVCERHWSEDRKPSTLGVEAREMQDQIDALLSLRFFKEIGRMQRVPLDNQTLQKREGYREVLQAWILTQAASSLQWEGEKDCYEGETRNVATLYEYWIFIQLHKLFDSIPGLNPVEPAVSDPDRFISESDGQLTINLHQGRLSRSRYVWTDRDVHLHIDLQYERSFGRSGDATLSGSYSRKFRPDYTVSIYPASFASEAHAEKSGKVAHLHFDAKYRAEDLTDVFGSQDPDDETIAAEKLAGKSESTYKRGDLLKMHTYNDALRHTIGSYVLYPGSKTDSVEKLIKFHEIAPGVGAMVMKPGNDHCLEALREFLVDVFHHQADLFSQYRYLSDTTHQTHREAPQAIEESGSTYNIARKDAPCVVLWLRKRDELVFRENGFAYCRAISEEHKRTLNLNLSIEVGSEFIPCGGGQGEAKLGYGWRAKVKAARFLSKEKLIAYIQAKGLEERLKPDSVDHYLLFEFTEASSFKEINLTDIYRSHRSGSDYMAVTCQWGDILASMAQPFRSL